MALLTAYWVLDGLLVLASLVVAAYLYMTRKFKYWEKRGIMEAKPVPFVGNFGKLLLQKCSPGAFIKELYDSAKGLPYMGFYIFDKPAFLVRDPELVKHVLVKDFNYFPNRYAASDVHDRIGYANVFMIRNPAWRVLRQKMSPIYTSGKLKKLFELMLQVTEDLGTYLESLKLGSTGKVLEMKELCAGFTTDLIGTTAYGIRANSLIDPNAEFRKNGKTVFHYSMRRSLELTSIFFVPDVVNVLGSKFFGDQCSNFLRTAFWDMYNQRVQMGIKRNDLIDHLMEMKEKHKGEDLGGFKFEGDDLVAQAAVFFSGGFETSSTALSFILYELALQPEIQSHLRKEIRDALEESDGTITYEMVNNLPYLQMCFSEILRKYPPLPFLDRTTDADYKVPNSDLVLEKGTPVYMSMIGMHYDPEYFPDPEKYDPERFNEENKRKIPSIVYFPFGDGPRICIGMRLGLIQSKLGLIEILRNYEVAVCDKTLIPMKLDPKGLTTTAAGGMYLTLRTLPTAAG